MKLIERGVQQKEPRYINRAVRCIQTLRKKTNDAILRRVTVAYYPAGELVLQRERECSALPCSLLFLCSISSEGAAAELSR